MRALLIDDNPGDLYLLRATLARIGTPFAEVDEVTDARAALERLEAGETFDIIFLDLNMPLMNGLDFLERFAGSASELRTRVYILSSSDHERDLELVDRFDCVTGYLIKPASPADLRLAIGG